MLLGLLGVCFLGNTLEDQDVIQTCEGTIKAEQNF